MSVETITKTEAVQKAVPEKGRITVLVTFPHLAKYGHETTRELVYGCRFEVAVGDLVKCPPTRLYSRWTTGMVVALDGKGYRGPVKQVRRA